MAQETPGPQTGCGWSACAPRPDPEATAAPEQGGWRGGEVPGRRAPGGESGRPRGQSGAGESWAGWSGAAGGRGRGSDVCIPHSSVTADVISKKKTGAKILGPLNLSGLGLGLRKVGTHHQGFCVRNPVVRVRSGGTERRGAGPGRTVGAAVAGVGTGGWTSCRRPVSEPGDRLPGAVRWGGTALASRKEDGLKAAPWHCVPFALLGVSLRSEW